LDLLLIYIYGACVFLSMSSFLVLPVARKGAKVLQRRVVILHRERAYQSSTSEASLVIEQASGQTIRYRLIVMRLVELRDCDKKRSS